MSLLIILPGEILKLIQEHLQATIIQTIFKLHRPLSLLECGNRVMILEKKNHKKSNINSAKIIKMTKVTKTTKTTKTIENNTTTGILRGATIQIVPKIRYEGRYVQQQQQQKQQQKQ